MLSARRTSSKVKPRDERRLIASPRPGQPRAARCRSPQARGPGPRPLTKPAAQRPPPEPARRPEARAAPALPGKGLRRHLASRRRARLAGRGRRQRGGHLGAHGRDLHHAVRSPSHRHGDGDEPRILAAGAVEVPRRLDGRYPPLPGERALVALLGLLGPWARLAGEAVGEVHRGHVLGGELQQAERLRGQLEHPGHGDADDGQGDQHFQEREACAVPRASADGALGRRHDSTRRLLTRPERGSTLTR